MKTAAVILAAGASRRLGRPKQLAVVGGERLLERAVRACREAELYPTIVVLGANAEEIADACDLKGTVVVQNEGWNEGAASSVRAGIGALGQEPVDAALVMTCDMPFVNARHLRALLELAERERSNAASWYEQARGVPACYLRSSFADLLALQGDIGGRRLLVDAPVVELLNGLDVDTAEDLNAAEVDELRMKT